MNDWLVHVAAPALAARSRIVALPWAGGGTAVYRRWATLLPAEVALTIVRLPGRESRLTEPPLTDMDAVVDALAPLVAELTAVPTMIFGYSLGALIGYELCVRLQALGGTGPVVLAVGGSNAPHVPREQPSFAGLDDAGFVAALRDLEGTPAEIFEHPELLALVLPTLRADFTLLDNYRPRAAPPLNIPIASYTGTRDPEVTPAGVARWAELTRAPTTHRSFPGGHFFVTERADEVVAAVVADLVELAGRSD